ncbi:MAG: hypothetical protein DDG58_02965 [Ardenticatenia bacterium]|nr:MAG: hypothetical protein DDG58_02965 [Ardenticatenia bacterium]
MQGGKLRVALGCVVTLLIVPALVNFWLGEPLTPHIAPAYAQEPSQGAEDQIATWLSDSLHGTTRGMGYFYGKEQGGMELLTGIPYEDLPCKNCHTRYNKGDKKGEVRCESCHIADAERFAPPQSAVKLPQFAEAGPSGCLSCHRRQAFEWTRTTVRLDAEGKPVTDPVSGVEMQVPAITDVHRSAPPAGKGLQCVNCHDTGDTHGDGKIYNSLLESPNTECTDCHQPDKLSQHMGHQVHANNMTCAACHVQTVVSCFSCHINAIVKGAPEFPYQRVFGWKFLIQNDEGKYDVGNLMAAVYTDDAGEVKTFAVIAPYYGHSVASLKGDMNKACAQCHDNSLVKAYNETGSITISQWDASANKVVFPALEGKVVPVPADYAKAFKLAYPVISNLDEVAAAGADAEKTAKWMLGKEGVDLWQMLYAKPLDKMPAQVQFNFPTPTPTP